MEHREVFENDPIIGFKNGKSLKAILLRAKVPPLKTEEGFCGPCNEPLCEICKHITITKTHQYESSPTKSIYFIKPQNLNRAFKNFVHLFTCKTCINNTQEALKNSGLDLIITDLRMGTF